MGITAVAGRTVLVTGANRGIGQALVEEALRRGAARVYAGTRQPLNHADDRVISLLLDITDPEAVRAAAAAVPALDVLVNNAGVALPDDLGDEEVLERHLAVNLFGTWKMCRAFAGALAESGGAVVNVLSLASLAPVPMIPAYSISKAAAFSLTQALRVQLAAAGVSVHGVLTGPTDTEMSRGLEVPKAPPASVARAIFDGVEAGEEDIFPDPMSALLRDGWSAGAVKVLEGMMAGPPVEHADPEAESYTATFTVPQTTDEAFRAINRVRDWWYGEIEGETDRVGAVFTYRNRDVHRSTQEVTELIPGRRVAWHVLDGSLSFVEDRTEWTGTDIVFELAEHEDGTQVRFTHVGLAPRGECYAVCSDAWGTLINGSLRRLILTGEVQGDPFRVAV